MADIPFRQTAPTLVLEVDSEPAPAVQLQRVVGSSQVIITNKGDVAAFVAFGNTEQDAIDRAIIPDGINESWAVPILGGAIITLSIPKGSWCSGITETGSTTIYLNVGSGS